MSRRNAAYLLPIAWLAFSAGAYCAEPGDVSTDRRWEMLAQRFIEQWPALSPVGATALGDHRFDARLDEVSAEARGKEAALCREYLRQLAGIERARLSRSNQVDYAIVEHQLRGRIWQLEVLQEWAWNPLLYTQLAGGAVYRLLARDFAPLPKRLVSLSERLEQFPRLFEQIRSTLQPARVPKIHAQTAVDQNRGILTILDKGVRPHLDVLDSERRGRLVRALKVAEDAVNEHQRWLESELATKAAGDFRLGPKLYDKKLAFTLHTPRTRAEIRELGERRVRELHDKMFTIASRVYRQRYPLTEFPREPSDAYKRAIIRAGLEVAYSDAPSRDGIVDAAKRSLAMTTAFVRKRNLVTLPSDPLEIIVMPEFERGVSLAYCDAPGPLDAGQKTFYAVSPIADDWTPVQVGSFLREYNTRSIHILTIHEAMPGHFLQLAHANRCPHKLRSVFGSGPFAEGWAEYVEGMMCEQGFLDNDPLMQLILFKWYLREVTNAILDQAVHVDGITRERAMKLMMEDAFQEEREAVGKWKRAQLTSTQLSEYFIGYIELTDMRREAEKQWGDKFDLKTFHDKVISFGSPPPQFVRALLLDREIPDGM